MNFDPSRARRFKARYDLAVKDGEEQFSFEGADFLTSYAKYVLEYLKTTKGFFQND